MTTLAWLFLAIAGALAVADWIVVTPGRRDNRLEYLLKPGTMVALIVVAIALEPESAAQRSWFVAALILSLAGDVFLMLPADLFVAGLASFLLAHVAYIIGFVVAGFDAGTASIGLVIVALAAATLGVRIIQAVRTGHPALQLPVTIYMTVISVMVYAAFGSEEPLAIAGALVFYASDSVIAWDRFVEPKGWARPAIMSTYHVAQALLVLSLLR
jgi:uncharacterized membrane protein YhhN